MGWRPIKTRDHSQAVKDGHSNSKESKNVTEGQNCPTYKNSQYVVKSFKQGRCVKNSRHSLPHKLSPAAVIGRRQTGRQRRELARRIFFIAHFGLGLTRSAPKFLWAAAD